MSGVLLVARRELWGYLRSPVGYLLAALTLLVDGLLFVAYAVGEAGAKRYSAFVLQQFFYGLSGVTMFCCTLLAMRLIAHEEEHATLVLLKTSPLKDRQIVLGKYLSVMVAVLAITLLTLYMPALIFVRGRVSVGHIAIGYLGIALLASAVTAIGIFASSLARTQLVAVILAAVMVAAMLLLWWVARVSDPPVKDFVNGLALHHKRQFDFMDGVLRLENVAYYLSVTVFFLLAAQKTLEARRWR
ncbi:MAG: ABC transporter permease [Polyangiaceae bacterium]|nr:ABC transporter permease [Polyangiaceae bacterium]